MVRWKTIPTATKDLGSGWRRNKKAVRDFISTFGFDRYGYAHSGSIVHAGKFLRCETGYNSKTRYPYQRFDAPPCLDHSLIFHKTGTTRRMWVYHPYIPCLAACDIPEFILELEIWCNERGIIYVFCPQSKSFYYPGKSYMVMLMSEETYVDCLSIPGFPQEFEYTEDNHNA